MHEYTIFQVPNNRDESEDISNLNSNRLLHSITLVAYLESQKPGGKADLHPNDMSETWLVSL